MTYRPGIAVRTWLIAKLTGLQRFVIWQDTKPGGANFFNYFLYFVIKNEKYSVGRATPNKEMGNSKVSSCRLSINI